MDNEFRYDDEIQFDDEIRLIDKIATVKKTTMGYELCFAKVTRGGRTPRIDLRYIGPDGKAGTGVALDCVDLEDLLQALVKTIKWQDSPENIAF